MEYTQSIPRQCKANISPYIGSIVISKLNVEHINHLYKVLHDKGLAPKSIRNIHGILHEALAVAQELGGIPDNPTNHRHILKLPKQVKEKIKPLTPEQIKDFLQASAGDPYQSYFALMLWTGLRESEALGLTWDCVDLKTGRILVEKQLQKRSLDEGGYCFCPLKNNRTRTLVVGPSVISLLQAEWQKQIDAKALAGSNWKGWVDEKAHRSALVMCGLTVMVWNGVTSASRIM